MNNNELAIFRYLLLNQKKNPFSLFNTNVLCCTHNISSGFWKEGESDILAIDKDFHIFEGEIKVSIEDFRRDFKKDIEIWKERKKYLYAKYYIMPTELFKNNEDEIFNTIVEFNRKYFVTGLITVDYGGTNIIYGSQISDYRIDLIKLSKLIRLQSFRQLRAVEAEINKTEFIDKQAELFNKNTTRR